MNMKINKGILLLALASLFLPTTRVAAQKTLLEATIDSASILIGEQTTIHLALTTDRGKHVEMYVPSDSLLSGVEVLGALPPDTTFIENNRQIVKQDVLITSFDSSLYLLPPFAAIDGRDTVYSQQIALKVVTIPVDLKKPKYYDIKTVWKPPFVLADYYALIYGVLFTLLLICIVGYVLQKIHNKQPIIHKKEKPKLPPYEEAMKKLEEIRQQKLWQQGRNKEYYTLITETLRNYIVDRFGISAMEMTSSEILEALRSKEEAKPVLDKLSQITELSDFVKFAKFNPLPDENDMSMNNAYSFVEQTKVVEQPDVTALNAAERPAIEAKDDSLKQKE